MADYPRELLLDSDTEERLISYIESELVNHYAERGGHVDDLMRWQKDYWATPLQKEATFPFKGAAIIIVPLSAIAIEAVHARTMTMTFGLPHFVSAHAIASDWADVDRAVERFLDYELMYSIKVRKPINDCFLEATKFGTMIGKVGYEKQVKFAVRQMGADMEEVFPVVVKDGAVVDAVPDSRFLMPYYAKDPQLSPWVGEEHSTTAYEVMTLEQAGMFRPGTIISDDPDPNVNNSKLGAWIAQSAQGTAETGREFEESQERLENTEPSWPEKMEWVELWLSFDVDGSRQEKEIVVHYHRPSRTFMSVRYNWNMDLSRPYRTGVYFPVEHRWRGIGICKKNEQFQREVTTQHRQRLDNATLANMRMIVIHKLSGYGPREPVFPGKMWFVDDMTHVQTIQMGDVYNSSYANEQATLLYSQQRTGVNEVTLGMPQVGTPGTATSDLARIQEGNKKFDFIYSNFREFVEQIIVDTAATIQQFGPRKLRYFETTENGRLVAAFFQMPEAHIRDGLLIQLKMAGQQQNKILDRQNWQQIAAHLQAYYTGLIQLAMPLGDQQLVQLILTKGIGAATEAMRQVLESFDIRNIDRIVLHEIEEMMQNGPNAAGPGAGGNNGSPGATPISPVDQLAQAFSPFENGGVPGPNRLLERA
jgi:hypothetical protein